jgi:hypothetical protein
MPVMSMIAAPGEAAQPPSPTPRIAWTELTCLVCGELAGYIEDHRIVRPLKPGRIRLERSRLGCGRCGGLLLAGERGTSTSQAGIG